jgi:hypothetical protein
MSEARVEKIKTFDGSVTLTEQKLKHQKSGKMLTYLSISNGSDVSGFYIDTNTKKAMAKFLNAKGATSGE